MRWLMRVLRHGRLERELDRELRSHVDEDARRREAAGVPAVDARRQALAAFGGLEPMRELTRDARGTRWLGDLGRDLRYALRMTRRNPLFTATAVLSLALGIGANGAIFSLTDALLLRQLDVAAPRELYFLSRTGFSEQNLRYSYPRLERLRAGVPEIPFAAAGAISRIQIDRTQGAELTLGQLVTGNWFQLLGVPAALGRVLEPADSATVGARPVVVVSHDYWTTHLGADPNVVGTTLVLNAATVTVVGVAAEKFNGLEVGTPVSLWAPVTMQRELRLFGNASIDNADSSKPWVTQDGIAWLTVVARIPDAAVTRAAGQIAAFERRGIEAAAALVPSAESRAFRLREHVEIIPGGRGLSGLRDQFSAPLHLLMATVAVVLLIACANLASLLLARGTARGREFALRLSLGAGRGRVIRQLLTESLTLAGLGGLAGLGVAQLGGRALLSMASSGTRPIPIDLPFDWPLIGYTAAVSLVTGVLFGLGPAVRASRASVADPLKAGSRVAGADRGSGRFGFGRLLIVLQVALSLALVVGALLFLQTFRNLVAVDTGFDKVRVVSARFDSVLAGVKSADLPDFHARLLGQAGAIPGVTNAALALSGPVTGSQRISTISVDQEPMRPDSDASAREDYISPDYFRALGISLVRGRVFTATDDARAPAVAVINEALARRFFGTRDPIGHRLGYGPPATVEIVGLVRNARVDGPRDDAPPMIYYPLAQNPGEFARNLYVRTTGPVDPARAALRAAVKNANAHVAVREIVTLDELATRMVTTDRLVSRLTGVFGLLAVAVACLGLYATVAYAVVRRTNEIGIRMALGATPRGVGWLVLQETLTTVSAGCAVGLAALWPLLQSVQTLLYGLSPRDPSTLAAATAGLLVVGMLAGAVPAWRATRVDPLTALRAD